MTDTDQQLRELVARFVNDAYWFDQMGCASPRLIIWKGTLEATRVAGARFHGVLLERLASREEITPTNAVIAKLVHATARAADGHVTHIAWANNQATVADLDDLGHLTRDSPGGGLFYQARIDRLEDLLSHVTPRDQTLTHHGLGCDELRDFAHRLGARGIDRIVPTGQALTFSHFWDGYDLIQQLSRQILLEN